MSAKGRVYQAVVCSILLYVCETWPVRVVDERMLASAAFYAQGAEIIRLPWNFVAASA